MAGSGVIDDVCHTGDSIQATCSLDYFSTVLPELKISRSISNSFQHPGGITVFCPGFIHDRKFTFAQTRDISV